MKLPIISPDKKWLAAVASYIAFALLYTLTGNLHFKAPVVLSPSPIDNFVPFIGWTVWIYHSQFFLLALNIALLKEPNKVSRLFYSLNLASLLSFVIFLIYPTTIPRQLPGDSGLTSQALALLYALDAPTNCFPSLHISLAWLSAIEVAQAYKKLGIVISLWTILISLSTLTTKQHYFVDVIGGLLVGVICFISIRRVTFN